ncbi:hypothetical protein SEUCBS140593_010355 [Sporothrix eucalyptigena]|uniref:2-methylcitrate dehydratase PrpD n=1 Tax=Sporothrix eucalyptigena TaxID=1812306 RepID=A0ABP0D138_9PEZI
MGSIDVSAAGAGQANKVPGIEQLATWSAALRYDDVPVSVLEKTKDFFLDWYACALGGRSHPSVQAITAFAMDVGRLGGEHGSELLHRPGVKISSAFAALVNGAASHVVEQDDLHNSSMVHPATVVFPAALAVAQEVGASSKAFLTACVAGYDVACRVGEFLGPSHYAKFHSTATAGVFGAAAATAQLLQLDAAQTLSALGSAGTQAAGLWQFLLDATHAKQVHTAKACFDGVFSAYVARAGLLGPRDILQGASGMAASMVPAEPQPAMLVAGLGETFSVTTSSFKWHASCRHTHASVDALLDIMREHSLVMDDLAAVVVQTYRSAVDILARSEAAETVHQSKFSMGFVLAVAAKYGRATVLDFTEAALGDPDLRAFQKRVRMEVDDAIEAAFPEKWQARVLVTTKAGTTYGAFMPIAKGDPGRHLTRDELEAKALRIAEYAGVIDMQTVKDNIVRAWHLEDESNMGQFACS